MGFSKKAHADGGLPGLESESRKWIIAGVSVCSLKPINTKAKEKENENNDEDACSTTPTSKDARIAESLPCPPAPRKRRPSRCHYSGVREFFTPPDLEAVFKCRVEKAN